MNDEQVIEFIKSDMIWHKPTQSFSHQIIFKILWNNALNDESQKFNNIESLDHIKKFRFTSQDFQAFTILDIPAGIEWKRLERSLKSLSKISP